MYRLNSELDRRSEEIVDDQCHKQHIFAVMVRKHRSNSDNPRRPRGCEHSVSGELILYTTEDGTVASRRPHGLAERRSGTNLGMVPAVSYRVGSHRDTQSRQWAAANLRLMAQSLNMGVKSIIYALVVS
jgi:hypothetical protein